MGVKSEGEEVEEGEVDTGCATLLTLIEMTKLPWFLSDYR